MKKLNNDFLATALGLLTAACTALAVLDFNTFDIKKDWFRVIVIVMPAIGGYISTVKNKKK